VRLGRERRRSAEPCRLTCGSPTSTRTTTTGSRPTRPTARPAPSRSGSVCSSRSFGAPNPGYSPDRSVPGVTRSSPTSSWSCSSQCRRRSDLHGCARGSGHASARTLWRPEALFTTSSASSSSGPRRTRKARTQDEVADATRSGRGGARTSG
jgi:hypothetical protein